MKDLSVSHFWEKFVRKKDYGVKLAAAHWYTHIKLSRHEPHFVEKFFESKGRNTRIEAWQSVQLITAV